MRCRAGAVHLTDPVTQETRPRSCSIHVSHPAQHELDHADQESIRPERSVDHQVEIDYLGHDLSHLRKVMGW